MLDRRAFLLTSAAGAATVLADWIAGVRTA